jgi:hypothetical protein
MVRAQVSGGSGTGRREGVQASRKALSSIATIDVSAEDGSTWPIEGSGGN